jgi:subtilisin family serine protease
MKRLIFLISFLLLFSILYSADFDLYLNHLANISEGKYKSMPQMNLSIQGSLGMGETIPGELLLFGKGDSSAISSYGGKIQTRAGNYFTALVPTTSLPAIRSEKRIEFLHYRPFVKKYTDLAVPYVSGDQTYTIGYKGDDVIVGVVDTGIDISHPDFTTENGLSRILTIWDQTIINPRVIPYGFDYGREWTKYEIDQGLCTEIDKDAHGTHVSGIAAGNGKASQGQFRGVSPSANIIFVKLNFASLGYVLDAVNYIFYKARSLGKPCVINLSLGTQSGSHTELDTFNQAMDSVVDFYGRKGNIIVWAAGNEAGDDIHAMQSVSSSANISFNMAYNIDPFYADFWWPSGDLTIALLRGPGNTNISFTNTGTFSSIQTAEATLSVANEAGEKRISLNLHTASTGNWQLIVLSNTTTVQVDGYINNMNQIKNFFSSGVSISNSLSATACQKESLSIGAMVTRQTYTDYLGTPHSSSDTLYDITSYSGRGPSRDNKNKPDVSAPGTFLIAPLSSTVRNSISSQDKYNNYYAVLQGTSMAAPMATGVIAQMLEKEPYLTVDDVRQKFSQYAKTNDYKLSRVWDNAFGYGIVDLAFLPSIDASQASLDIIIKNNILNFSSDKDNLFFALFRSNSSQIGKNVNLKIFDKNGNLIRNFGPEKVNQIEVKTYVWDGKDQFGRIARPGLYFAVISLDSLSSRYSILVVR